jgi:hypothetical protein
MIIKVLKVIKFKIEGFQRLKFRKLIGLKLGKQPSTY